MKNRKITTHRGNARTEQRQYICGSCKHSLQDESIACDGCDMWFDLECQNLTSEQLKMLSQERVAYYCEKCESNFETLGGLSVMLSSLGYVGFNRLQLFVSKLDPTVLTTKFSQAPSTRCFNNPFVDPEARSIQKETGIHLDKRPIYSSRNGNCLFNALSICLCGNEDLSSALRVACCVELIKNQKRYRWRSSKMFEMTGVTYEEACVSAAISGSWQSNWATWAAANVLQRRIFSIYPPLPGCHILGVYNNSNQVFVPSSCAVKTEEDIYILWSSTSFDVKKLKQTKLWQANHFVPLISKTALTSPKKRKSSKRGSEVLYEKDNDQIVFPKKQKEWATCSRIVTSNKGIKSSDAKNSTSSGISLKSKSPPSFAISDAEDSACSDISRESKSSLPIAILDAEDSACSDISLKSKCSPPIAISDAEDSTCSDIPFKSKCSLPISISDAEDSTCSDIPLKSKSSLPIAISDKEDSTCSDIPFKSKSPPSFAISDAEDSACSDISRESKSSLPIAILDAEDSACSDISLKSKCSPPIAISDAEDSTCSDIPFKSKCSPPISISDAEDSTCSDIPLKSKSSLPIAISDKEDSTCSDNPLKSKSPPTIVDSDEVNFFYHDALPTLNVRKRRKSRKQKSHDRNLNKDDFFHQKPNLKNEMCEHEESKSQPKNDAKSGKLSSGFMMPVPEAISKLESFSGVPYPTIPEGNKSNMFFVIDNTRNVNTKGTKLYRDDCGAWRGSSRTRILKKESGDVTTLYKYNTYLKNQPKCKRRILVLSSKPNIALVEYSGNFRDPKEPHGRTEFSATAVPYIRTNPVVLNSIRQELHNKTDKIMADMLKTDGMTSIRDRKLIYNMKNREKVKSMPFRSPAPKTFADQVQEVMTESNKENNQIIQKVLIRKEGVDIYLYTQSMVKYMRNACLFSVPKAVIVADKTYNLCSTYVTTTTFKFSGVIRRSSGDCPLLLGPIMLHTKSDSESYESFFSHLRRILKLHEAGPDARIFIGSDDERALSKSATDAIPEAVHVTCLNHLKKNVNDYLSRKEGCNETQRRAINGLLFGNGGLVFSEDENEFEKKWNDFLKKIQSMKKFHAYCQKRLQDLILNSVVKPHSQDGLNPTWTNNNAECMNHVLKQSVDWKKKSLLQLIKVLERLLFLQDSHMTGVLFGCGDFALAKSWKSSASAKSSAKMHGAAWRLLLDSERYLTFGYTGNHLQAKLRNR